MLCFYLCDFSLLHMHRSFMSIMSFCSLFTECDVFSVMVLVMVLMTTALIAWLLVR